MWRYSEHHDEVTGRYRLEVDLVQAAGQVSMKELTMVAQPSDLDDWDLYKRLVAEGAIVHGQREEGHHQICTRCGRPIGVRAVPMRVRVTRKLNKLVQNLR